MDLGIIPRTHTVRPHTRDAPRKPTDLCWYTRGERRIPGPRCGWAVRVSEVRSFFHLPSVLCGLDTNLSPGIDVTPLNSPPPVSLSTFARANPALAMTAKKKRSTLMSSSSLRASRSPPSTSLMTASSQRVTSARTSTFRIFRRRTGVS